MKRPNAESLNEGPVALEKKVAVVLVSAALLVGRDRSTTGSIRFGTGFTGGGRHLAVTDARNTFKGGAVICVVGYLSSPISKSLRIVLLRKRGNSEIVLEDFNKSSKGIHPSDTVVGFQWDFRKAPAGTYEVRFQHRNAILADGTFSIRR